MMGAINEFQILRLCVTPSETFIKLSSRIRDSEFETTRARRARSTPTSGRDSRGESKLRARGVPPIVNQSVSSIDTTPAHAVGWLGSRRSESFGFAPASPGYAARDRHDQRKFDGRFRRTGY